ncbi:DUF2397 family protein [Salinactinospora qingdaonensis]
MDNHPTARRGRAALLRLAAWFDTSDTATAHEVFTAAFAMHAARHLGGAGDTTTAVTTSWWHAPAADTSAAHPAGAAPPAPAQDHSAQQARLRDAAEAAAHWRQSAAQEVRSLLAAPTDDDARLSLSSAALDVLMELLTAALGSGDATAGRVSAGDMELDLRLHVDHAPEATVTLCEPEGELLLQELRMHVTRYDPEAVSADTGGHTPLAKTGHHHSEERLVRQP